MIITSRDLPHFLTPTLALAHPGDHLSMTVGQVAHHIATSPDHLLEVGFAALMTLGEALRVRRRRARGRSIPASP